MKFLQPLKNSHLAPLLNSPTRLEKMAQKSGWLKRQARKLFPIDFIRGVLLGVSQSESSLRSLAGSIGLHADNTLSKSALWERINPQAVEFFKSVLAELITSQLRTSNNSIPGLQGICRIVGPLSVAVAYRDDFQSAQKSYPWDEVGLSLFQRSTHSSFGDRLVVPGGDGNTNWQFCFGLPNKQRRLPGCQLSEFVEGDPQGV